MLTIRAFFTLATIVAGVQVGSANAQGSVTPPSIVGLTLGMTKEDAIKAIREHDSAITFDSDEEWVMLPSTTYPEQVSLPATLGRKRLASPEPFAPDKTSELFRLILSGVPGESRVLAIARAVVFNQTSQPSLQQLTKDIQAKYGVPSERDDGHNGLRLYWSYDQTQTKVLSGSTIRCRFRLMPFVAHSDIESPPPNLAAPPKRRRMRPHDVLQARPQLEKSAAC